jgi:hypothetical protein
VVDDLATLFTLSSVKVAIPKILPFVSNYEIIASSSESGFIVNSSILLGEFLFTLINSLL